MVTRNQGIAGMILNQMGGINRLSVMVGAKNIVAIKNGVQFKFKMSVWNCVAITLDTSDTYAMQFIKIRGLNVKSGPKVSGIYSDMLQRTFTEHTGLDTHL